MSQAMGVPDGNRGLWAEQLALQHLREHGLRPHSRNYRWRGGEIDLVMLHDETVVFVAGKIVGRFVIKIPERDQIGIDSPAGRNQDHRQ